MIVVLYSVVAVGLILLALDLAGLLRVGRLPFRLARLLGLLCAAVPGLYPFAVFIGHWWAWSGATFPVVATAHLGLFLAYTIGVLGLPTARTGTALRRVAYFSWIVLAALPSFVLLPITGPFVGLAGLALCRALPERASDTPGVSPVG